MRLLFLAAALPLAACGFDSPDPSADAADPTGAPGPTESAAPDRGVAGGQSGADSTDRGRPVAPGARPEQAAGVIQVEGEDETIDLRLVSVWEFPLPFETYVPDGWVVDQISAGEGASAILASSDATPRGIVSVFVPADRAPGAALATAREIAQQRGGVQTIDGPEWASEALTFRGDGHTGTVYVGEHAGSPFMVLVEYPSDMGDGFAPRADLVLDRLRWGDDGTAL